MRHLRATAELRPPSPLTRRGVLSGLPMAIAGGAVVTVAANPVPAPCAPQPDAELIQLGEAFEAAWRAERGEWLLAECKDDITGEAAYARACVANHTTSAMVDRIMTCRALTLDGLRIKARAVSWCHSGDPIWNGAFGEATDSRLVVSIIRDLLGE